MSPEEYAALLKSGKVTLRRDLEGNYIFDANKATTGVLPRDIIEQLESDRDEAIKAHTAALAAFARFIADLKEAK